MFETSKGVDLLVHLLHPIMCAAVINYITQTQTTQNTHTLQLIDNNTGLWKPLPPSELPGLITGHHILHHPNAGLLLNTEYIKQVLVTIKERLHIANDAGKLAIPFFAEPSFATEEAKEMKMKIWNSDSLVHLQALYGTPTLDMYSHYYL